MPAPTGNQNARKENRLITDALRRAAKQDPESLREACLQVLQKAAQGDLAAFNVLADRLDGKPAQSVLLGEDAENPFTPEIQRPKPDKEEWLKLHGIKETG